MILFFPVPAVAAVVVAVVAVVAVVVVAAVVVFSSTVLHRMITQLDETKGNLGTFSVKLFFC